MTPRDLAELYLSKGHEDEVAASSLVPMPQVSDAIVGFHAQQAVEKYLKAVLAIDEAQVRKTHEIGALLDQLRELGREVPEDFEAAVGLTPYSVLERYPLAPKTKPLNRESVLDLIARIRAWASQLVQQA